MEKYSEIIIIGGGMAGCAAAVAAAKAGHSTLLIEKFGYPGGWGTAALVNPFMTHYTSDGKPLIGGFYDDLLNRLRAKDALLANSFDTEVVKYELQEMLLEAGARIRLHTTFDSASYGENGKILVRTRSKSGLEEFECLRLIDCSGDGDAAVSMGAGFEMGDENGLPQAVTLMFDMGGIDLVKTMTYVKDHPDQFSFPKYSPEADPEKLANDVISVAGYYDLVAKAKADGNYLAAGDMIFYIGRPRKGEVVFNTTHSGNVDGTNAEDLTRAEIECRRQMVSIAEFVRKYVPGFENSFLLRSADHVGIRETRRVIGDYVFSTDDVLEARKFSDAICRLAYPIDIHSGKGEGYVKGHGEHTGPNNAPPGDWYEIPYRCLIVKGLENVLVAGRCVSSTQAGHGAIRIMPACMAMGQAAGEAAALSIESGVALRDIDVNILLERLRSQGALV